MKWNIWSV